MYQHLKSEEYEKVFKEALRLLKLSAPLNCDHHDLAHQALELYFSKYKTLEKEPIKTCVQILLKEKACTSTGPDLEIKIDLSNIQSGCEEIASIEAALDLGRLYLEAAEFLDQDDKQLFLKIWSLEDLTEEETDHIEALGHKIRRILNAPTTTQKFYFKSGIQGKAQIYKWKAFYEQRLLNFAKIIQARNRRPGKRFRN